MGMDARISRREAVAMGLLGAAGAVLGLAGCDAGGGAEESKPREAVFGDGFLPLGSVVALDDGSEPPVARLIVARRPVCLDDDHVYDYAGIVWPIGFLSDVAGAPLENEIHLFDGSAVREVVHLGYSGPLEGEAASALEASRATGETALEALLPLAMEMGVIEAAS